MKELPSGYTIQILRSSEEIDKVRTFWEKNQNHPNGDIDLFTNITNSRKNVASPYLILILLDNKPEAMMSGIIEKKRIKVPISYKMLFGPNLRILTIIPERIFGNPNYICSHLFALELLASIKNKETDLVQ